MLGEAQDNFAQSEVDQVNKALGEAQAQSKPSGGARSFGGGSDQLSSMTSLLAQVPGAGALSQQAEQLQAQSNAQEQANSRDAQTGAPPTFAGPPGTSTGGPGPGIPGMSANFDPQKTAAQIYPILEFRDKVVRAISATIEKIPGLEALVEKITETLTMFVLSLLAPIIRPIINAVSKQLKTGSSAVIDTSGKHQYEPWTNPSSSDPTHSMLSKDHFSNILNEPAGQIAAAILQYVAPRVMFAWQHPDVPVHEVLNDVSRVFHHPALRDQNCELHRNMFDIVQRWSNGNGRSKLDLLTSENVRHGKNHIGLDSGHGGGLSSIPGVGSVFGGSSGGKTGGMPWDKFKDVAGMRRDDLDAEPQSVPGAFPGTNTAFDSTRPPTGPMMGYDPNQGQSYGQNPYGQSQGPTPYDQGVPPQQLPMYSQPPGPPEWQQQGGGYGGPQSGGQFPPQDYPPQQQQFGGIPPYGYDPNGPPPPGQGYGGPAPQGGQYYGGGY